MHSRILGATVGALLAGAALIPVSALAAPAPNTGTLVGVVTCGPTEDAPASHIVISAEGTPLYTQTDANGAFSLSVPAQQAFTIDAIADPQSSFVTSRFDVSVQPGQTLDIGSMDLAVCGQPRQSDQAPADVQPQDYAQGAF